jgi:hypothetical protein
MGKSPHDFRRPIPPHLTHAAQTALPSELNQAEHDKGGHLENAVGLVQQAINQVNQGIVAGGGTP